MSAGAARAGGHPRDLAGRAPTSGDPDAGPAPTGDGHDAGTVTPGGEQADVVRLDGRPPDAPAPRLPDSAETAAAVMIAAGFPKMPARALMALVVSEDGSLTAAEFTAALGASPAAVSGAVRYLQTVGFVHRVSQPGSRRDRYALPGNAWYVATLRQNPVYERLAAVSATMADDLPDGSAARARVEEMAHFYRFLMGRMPELLDEWERERSHEG